MGEHHALPGEMLTKKQVFYLFSSCCGVSQDTPTSLAFHIPQIGKTCQSVISCPHFSDETFLIRC